MNTDELRKLPICAPRSGDLRSSVAHFPAYPLLDWFKDQGPGYQSRMNAVLAAYMKAHRKGG